MFFRLFSLVTVLRHRKDDKDALARDGELYGATALAQGRG